MNWSLPAFGVVAVIACLGIDFSMQAKKAGVSATEFTPSRYFATYSDRYTAMKLEQAMDAAEVDRKARVKAGTASYLPAAPEGWTRRTWAESDNTRLDPPREMSKDEQELRSEIGSTLVGGMLMANEEHARKNRPGFVYQKGNEIIHLTAKVVAPFRNDTVSGLSYQMLAGNMGGMTRREGFAMVQGVPFGRSVSMLDQNKEDTAEDLRTIQGFIGLGHEVRINVKALASDQSIREVLAGIDYDGLNALLPKPEEGVGSHVEELDLKSQKFAAEAWLRLRDKMLLDKARKAEETLKNSDPMALAAAELGAAGNPTVEASLKTLKPKPKLKAKLDKVDPMTAAINKLIDTGTSDAAVEARGIFENKTYSEQTRANFTDTQLYNMRPSLLQSNYEMTYIALFEEVRRGQTAENAKSAAPKQEAKGFFATIGSMFSGSKEAQPTKPAEVKVSSGGKFGLGTCNTDSGFKRCKLGE